MVLAIYRGRPLWVDSTQVVPANQPYPATCPGACVCVCCVQPPCYSLTAAACARAHVCKRGGGWAGSVS